MHKEQFEFNLKQIAGTLKYGGFDGAKKKYIITAYIVYLLVCNGFILGFGLTMIIMNIVQHNGIAGLQDILSIAGAFLMSFLLSVPLGIIIYKNERHREEIKHWLGDAVMLKAYIKIIDVIQVGHFISTNDRYKIQVEFLYDGQKYRQESRGHQFVQNRQTCGYHNIWKDYANKKVNILYSPKYEEVMILKFNRHRESEDTSKEMTSIDSQPSGNDTPQT